MKSLFRRDLLLKHERKQIPQSFCRMRDSTQQVCFVVSVWLKNRGDFVEATKSVNDDACPGQQVLDCRGQQKDYGNLRAKNNTRIGLTFSREASDWKWQVRHHWPLLVTTLASHVGVVRYQGTVFECYRQGVLASAVVFNFLCKRKQSNCYVCDGTTMFTMETNRQPTSCHWMKNYWNCFGRNRR